MLELLSRFGPGELIGLAAVVGGLAIGPVIAIVAIVCAYWESARRAEINSRLVRDMLDRDVPRDEIVDVLLAMGCEQPDKALLRARARHEFDEPQVADYT